MANYLMAAAMRPDFVGAAQEGFVFGRQQGLARNRDRAMNALMADPTNPAALNSLYGVDPQSAAIFEGRQQQQIAGQQQAARAAAFGRALSELDNIPEPVRAYVEQTGDADGGMALFKTIGSLNEAQRAQAKAEAEETLARAIASGQAETPEAQSMMSQVLGVKGMLDWMDKQQARKLDLARFEEQRRANADASARGWAQVNLSAARGSQGGQNERLPAPPSGYQWAPDGQSLIAIPGGPASAGGAKLTEAQAKDGFNANRMVGAGQVIDQLENTPGFRPGAAGALSLFGGEKSQQYEAAKGEWIDALIRLTTGAAATKDEIDAGKSTYFPSPKDKSDTIRAKAQMRARVMRDAIKRAGPAIPSNRQPAPGVPASGQRQRIRLDAQGRPIG